MQESYFTRKKRDWFVAIITLMLVAMGSSLSAQPKTLTLDEAIQQGLEQRNEIKNAALNIELAERENTKLRGQWLPQLSGTADLRWNTQLQTTILPFDITGRKPDGRTEIKFGLPFNNNLGLNAEQKILNPQSRYSRQLNDTRVESERTTAEQQRISIRQEITEAYYQVVFNQEKIQLAEASLDRTESNLAIAQTRLSAGTLLPNDFDRAKLDKSNAELSLRKARQDYTLALQNLQYRMGVPQDNQLQLSTTLAALLSDTIAVAPSDLAQRPEIKAEELNFRIQELSENREFAARLPTLSAYGNYTALQLSDTFNPFKAGTWYPFNYLGLRLNVPIFDGQQARLAAGDYRIRQRVSRNALDQLRQDFTYETQNALTTLYQTRLDVVETQANVELARQILATDQFRYEKEVLTLSELNNTQNTLQNAENNYLTSVYNYLVALVRYRKAAGLL